MKKKFILQVVNEERNDELIFKGEFYSEESLLEFIGKPHDRVMKEYVDGIRPVKKEEPKKEEKPMLTPDNNPPRRPQTDSDFDFRMPDGGKITINEGRYNPETGERY